MVLNMTKGIYGQINLHFQCARNAANIQDPRRLPDGRQVAVGLK